MKLTIYSPAYNKGLTIKRTFESLIAQTCYDFEWILINDGSSDNTDDIVRSFSTDLFEWRYISKANEGLSRVMNLAVSEAKGEYILRLDADDCLASNAVETILRYIETSDIKDPQIGALVFLTCYEGGETCGFHPFNNIKRCNFWDYRFIYKATGDRAEVFKTSYFRKFPMPSFPNERFVGESIVWNRFSDAYDAIYIPEAVLVREYNENSITTLGAIIRIKNPKGCQATGADYLNRPLPFKLKLKESVNYFRYSLHSDYSIIKLIKDIPLLYTFIGIIPGTLLFCCEKIDNRFMSKVKKIF